MEEFEVVPDQGAGPVRLGMTRAESRAAMPTEPASFQKGGEGPPVDGYFGSSFQVFFDQADRVEYIELSATEEFRAIFAGRSVLEMEADDAVEFVTGHASFDETDPELGHEYVFPDLALALWRPVVPDDDEVQPDFSQGLPPRDEGWTFAVVAVARQGYWDGLW